jgi:hypothetical protein
MQYDFIYNYEGGAGYSSLCIMKVFRKKNLSVFSLGPTKRAVFLLKPSATTATKINFRELSCNDFHTLFSNKSQISARNLFVPEV